MTISRKKGTDSVNSSAVLPFHLTESDETALVSRYTPMTVKIINFPWISKPRTPAYGSHSQVKTKQKKKIRTEETTTEPAPPRKSGLEEAGDLTDGANVTEST